MDGEGGPECVSPGPVCDPACEEGQECMDEIEGEGVECFVDDCSDDKKCPAAWIGDGISDCSPEDMCDLSCYDNDGGDCDGGGEPA